MSQSTPLDKLDGPGSSDAGLVNKILADMNGPNEAMFQQQPMRMVLSEPPINTMQERVMDPAPATAHMIGNSSPTPQDFSSMMSSSSYSQIPQQQPQQIQMPAVPQKSDLLGNILDRLKAPLVVAALFFLLNLPVFHTSIMAYAPWAFRSGSELSWVGLVLLSVLAGSLFGGYQLLSDIIG
jgi:hypothetical protein